MTSTCLGCDGNRVLADIHRKTGCSVDAPQTLKEVIDEAKELSKKGVVEMEGKLAAVRKTEKLQRRFSEGYNVRATPSRSTSLVRHEIDSCGGQLV